MEFDKIYDFVKARMKALDTIDETIKAAREVFSGERNLHAILNVVDLITDEERAKYKPFYWVSSCHDDFKKIGIVMGVPCSGSEISVIWQTETSHRWVNVFSLKIENSI